MQPSVVARISCSFVLSALLVVALACGDGSTETPQRRVILIGLDGASPRITNPMIREGRLPNLAMLAREGASGLLRSSLPIQSPRIWNTIATGLRPEQHGIESFSFKGRDDKPHLYTSTHRKARTLWSIASAAGLRVCVVNFWNTFPLEIVNGVMVSDHVLAKEIEERVRMTGTDHQTLGSVIYPEAWNERLARIVRENKTPVPKFKNPFDKANLLPRWVIRDELSRRFREDGAIASMAYEIMRVESPDVTMVLLPGIDRISHYLWGVMEPPDVYTPELIPTPEERTAGREALFAYYEYADALVGKLIDGFGPNDLVMVVSDHGFEAEQSMLRLTGSHDTDAAIHGVIYAKGPGIEPGSQIERLSIHDITPTLLAWLGLPIARDMEGHSASFLATSYRESVDPVDTYKNLPLEFINPEGTPSGVEGDIVEQLRALGYIDPS